MPYALSNGVRIHYAVAGEGPPMVLLHAIPFDHTLWQYQIAHFSTWFKVIAIDIRPWGRSEAVTTPYAIGDLVNDVLSVCAQEGVKRCVLVGLSVGSRIAMQCALDHPDRFDAVVLIGGGSGASDKVDRRINDYAALDGKPQALADYRREHLIFGVSPGFPKTALGRYLIETFVERSAWTNGRAISELFKAFGHVDHTARLGEFKMPLLVINGEFCNSLDRGKWTAAHIPGAIHHTIMGAGHACNIEDPAEFDRVVTEFLKAKGHWPG
jgi:pimeloyl-ACP methyl ester carboxylesterase